MDILCVPHNKIPPEGTLPRCEHSVYDPDGKGKSWGCGLCRAPNYLAPTKGFTLPRSSSDPLSERDHLRANKHMPGSCPGCGSTIHFSINKTTWVCADCDQDFPAPFRQVFHADTLSTEMVDACK